MLRDRERERSPPFPALYRAGLAPRSSRAALVTSKWVADCESLPHRAQKRPVRAPPHVTQKIIEVSAQPRQCAAAARRRLVRLSAVRRLRSCSATVSPPPATAAGHRRLRCCCCLGPTRRPVLPTGGRSFGGRGVVCPVWCAAGPGRSVFLLPEQTQVCRWCIPTSRYKMIEDDESENTSLHRDKFLNTTFFTEPLLSDGKCCLVFSFRLKRCVCFLKNLLKQCVYDGIRKKTLRLRSKAIFVHGYASARAWWSTRPHRLVASMHTSPSSLLPPRTAFT